MLKINQPKNQKAKIVSPSIPGPKSRELRAKEDNYIAPGLQGFALMSGIVVDEASGSAVTDIDGNTFLDIIGGIGVNGLGHSHPKWIKAVSQQIAKASVGSFTSESRINLLKKIADHRPTKELYRTQLYSSGAEAIESAMRLAKAATGKWEFVSFWGGFHGKTLGALSLMGSEFKNAYGPYASGSHIIPYANCYRCPLKTTYPKCGLACVEQGRKQLKMSKSSGIAAFLVEPMQGTAGNVIPPDDFLPAVRELANEMGALLLADEMITGFGRTGKFWGIDHSKVKPDIVAIGKQFGGGCPISGIISTTKITSAEPWSVPSGSSSSYGGNPHASAAGAAAITIIEKEGLVENSKKVGQYFLEQLKPFQSKYPFIGEVRGRGMFLAIELVKDKKTKEPLSKVLCRQLFDECLQRGLLTMSYAPSFRIQPSMTTDKGTIDEIVKILDKSFAALKKSF